MTGPDNDYRFENIRPVRFIYTCPECGSFSLSLNAKNLRAGGHLHELLISHLKRKLPDSFHSFPAHRGRAFASLFTRAIRYSVKVKPSDLAICTATCFTMGRARKMMVCRDWLFM